MFVSEIDVKLNRPIVVGGSGGEKTEAVQILISGPSVKHRHQAASLKAMFAVPWTKMIEKVQAENADAVKEARDKKTEEKAESETKNEDQNPSEFLSVHEVLDSISRYTDEKVGPRDALSVAIGYLKDMMTQGCATVNGKDMTPTMFDKMSYTDTENILGVFVSTFLLDSLFA